MAVEDAAAAEGAMLPFLRAALYRPISVLLVVPGTEAIPAAIQHRCPLVEVRQRVARWQVPEGRWSWARPTVATRLSFSGRSVASRTRSS